MCLLEEEMVLDELLLGGLIHTLEWVESTGKIAFEGLGSGGDLLHDLESLLLGDTWSKWVSVEVSSNSNSSGDDHGGLLLGELSVLEGGGIHIRDVLVLWSVLMVVHDDLIEKLVESGVGVLGTSVEADTGVEVLNTREAHHLEGNVFGI